MRAIRALAILLLSLAFAGCDGKTGVDAGRPIAVGTVVSLKALGHLYELEAIRAEGLTTAWQLRWDTHKISIQKDYRGIMTLAVKDEKTTIYNEFDPIHIDALFPLEVGKEVSFSGIQHDKVLGQESPFWTYITVRKKTEIEIKNGTFPVFVIDVTTDVKGPEAEKRTLRTMWYSPDLGMRLKSKYKSEDESFEVRILSVEPPTTDASPAATRGRGLGAVII